MTLETVGNRSFGIDIDEDSSGKGGYWLVARTADASGGIDWEKELKWHRGLDAARKSATRLYNKMSNWGD